MAPGPAGYITLLERGYALHARSWSVQRQTVRVGITEWTVGERLLRRGFMLEWITLGWNVVAVVVLAITAVTARSVALAGFGLDSLVEIGASTVVIWELSGSGAARQRQALRLIGVAFAVLAVYLAVQSSVVLVTGFHPRPSLAGIGWTAVTAVVMFALAVGKARPGRRWTTRCCAPRVRSPWSTRSSPSRCWPGWR